MDLNALRRLAGISTVSPTEVSAQQTNEFRKLAGLPSLPVKANEEAVVEKEEDEEEVTDEMPSDETPADELPDIVSSIAAEAEGKTGDELAALIKQVYDAGVADGISQAAPVEEAAKQAVASAQQEQEVCPSCSSAQVKTHSDGEKECHGCHKTWNVQGMKEESDQIQEDGDDAKMKADLEKIKTPSMDTFVARSVDKDEKAEAELKKFDDEMMKFWEKYRDTPLVSEIDNNIRHKMSSPGYWASGLAERWHGMKYSLEKHFGLDVKQYEKDGKYEHPKDVIWAAVMKKSHEKHQSGMKEAVGFDLLKQAAIIAAK